eukprot:Skav230612  [mRNA]  locus=scaffold3185:11140:12216:+ [translate_table: standard]
MPSLVFAKTDGSVAPFFVNSGDVFTASNAWKPDPFESKKLSRDDLLKICPNFQYPAGATKSDIVSILMRDWDEVMQFACQKSSSMVSVTVPTGTSDMHQGGSSGGQGYGGDGGGGDEPEDEPSDDNSGDEDIYQSDNEDWLEVFISNGSSTMVSEVKGSWLFKSIFYSVATKWKIGNTRVMRFVNVKGDTMIPNITIAQNEVKHRGTLTLLFDGVGGASQKRRAISIADMTIRETDLDGVKAVFNIKKFNSRGWLATLPADKVKDYLMEIENRKNLPQQVSSTLERINEFKSVKDWKNRLIHKNGTQVFSRSCFHPFWKNITKVLQKHHSSFSVSPPNFGVFRYEKRRLCFSKTPLML